mgnify:CR=1 FL=1
MTRFARTRSDTSGFSRPPRPTLGALLIGAVALCNVGAAAQAADGPPKLNVEQTCKSSERANAGISDNASTDGCLRSENEARSSRCAAVVASVLEHAGPG